METQRSPLNKQIAIVVIIAGLMTGFVLTWHLTRPEAPARYSPEYRVVDPGAAEAAILPEDAPPAPSAEEAPGGAADTPAVAPSDRPSAPERVAMEGARELMAREGVTDYVELTEELYVRLSAEIVIFTNAAQHEPNSDDVVAMQRLIADYTAGLLARHRVDPQDYYDYTQWVASDHERAKRIGEQILRAAEKRAQMRIEVRTVPGIAPAPVAPPDN